jgi:Uri superfamily endonuclease
MSRVRRHIGYAERVERRTPRWHVDHLLGSPYFRLVYAVCGITTDKLECSLATLLLPSASNSVTKFGCSDCKCHSHLGYFPKNPLPEVISSFHTLRITARIKTINTPNA